MPENQNPNHTFTLRSVYDVRKANGKTCRYVIDPPSEDLPLSEFKAEMVKRIRPLAITLKAGGTVLRWKKIDPSGEPDEVTIRNANLTTWLRRKVVPFVGL